MHISWNKEDGFKCEVPYGGWLMFCVGLSMLINALRGW